MTSPLATYLVDVLGITRFGVEPSAQASYKVIFILERPLSQPAQELFLKMVQAMKLKKSDYLMAEQSVPAGAQAIAYVSFDSQYSPLAGMFYVPTLSPEILTQNPELKKQAWSDLQKVMKQISIVEAAKAP